VTIFYIILSFSFSILVFLVIMSLLPDVDYLIQENFYLQELSKNDKIFLIGSSQIFQLDENIIEDYLKKNEKDYTVYNLGLASDDPENRNRTIDLILSKEPKIIVYGIEYRDFVSSGRTHQINQVELFPIIPKFASLLQILDLPLNNGILENPKFAFIRSVSLLFEQDKEDVKVNPKHPFFDRIFEYTTIVESSTLQKTEFMQRSFVWSINPPNTNTNFHMLKNMITLIENNDIEVIIFTTPHSPYFFESLLESQKINFNLILDELNNYLDTPIYELHDKYTRNDIWNDNSHLAINNKTNFYSEDISKQILRIDS